MAESVARPGTKARRRALFDEAAAIIALEYADDPTLKGLVRRLACSPRQLQRAFAATGQPGMRAYLRRVRVEHAAALLEQGWTVRAAAEAVGYRQAAQFAKGYRSERGQAPTAARQP